MRAWIACIGVLAASLSLIAIEGSGADPYVPGPKEEIYGTWQNGKMAQQKLAIAPDRFEDFIYATDVDPVYAGTMKIVSKWTDPQGNIWYKTCESITSGSGGFKGTRWQTLVALSKSATRMEAVHGTVREFDLNAFPSALDPKDKTYRLYDRTREYAPRRVLFGDAWPVIEQERSR